ncbi:MULTISPECIES: DUF1428 domain-containing protein [Hydrogenophaga]|uniref:RNA signal recognition particle 4.5S RNA n=1 Tax=Hydrogenophaga intermedia TaxID=65786 RepID=A0A1L1PAD1_HYDIT|nr:MULTISPECIES: DUF1428 domain-containing protein [Hydrogenophaga]AOS77726.1 RNA signal recognition particle [Hydrogenophaga sp. PBC]TMU75874.1 DUF1428 domain-containing protein [Hydrogenophaga intermedia]CDN86390.1 hypothetical protein BN948_00791 [Hydrogenophaga intermedia]
MSYVDGFMAPVPAANRDEYLKHCKDAAAVFKDYGATRVVETWADDVPEGKVTSMPMAVKLEKDEVVVFSWVVWPSKAVRDAGWEKIMADPRMQPDRAPMPFDAKRMIYGGFNVILDV